MQALGIDVGTTAVKAALSSGASTRVAYPEVRRRGKEMEMRKAGDKRAVGRREVNPGKGAKWRDRLVVTMCRML